MSRKRAELQVFSVSFLDVISCALGGVLLLLLMISSRSQAEAQAHKAQAKQMQQTISQTQSSLSKVQSSLSKVRQSLSAAEQRAREAERQAENLARTQKELQDAEEQARIMGQAIEELQNAQKALLGFKGELKNVVFVFDISGSMGQSGRFEEDRDYLKKLMHNLVYERFNVIWFNDQIASMSNSLVDKNPSNESQAYRKLDGLQPGGTTFTKEALRTAISMPGVDTIMFFSDGAPSDAAEEEIIEFVRAQCRGRIVINTIAVGQFMGVNNQHKPFVGFLQDIAINTGGFPMLYNP